MIEGTVFVNGVDISYSRHGMGTPLVLIHGFPLDRSIWDDVVPLLERSFDLILPDLRGFGKSTTVDSVYTLMDMARDLAGLLDYLEMEKSALAGHSMGGYVALAFAKLYPKRVRGLGLVSSQAIADTPERRASRYVNAEEVGRIGPGSTVEGMTTKLSPDQRVQKIVRDIMERQSPAGIIGAFKAMAEREDSTSLVASSDFPIVLVHGDADALIPIDQARETKLLLPSAHLVELQGAGHMPMLEEPERTAKALALLV